MNKRLLKLNRKKYSNTTKHMYVAVSKQNGRFLRNISTGKVAWNSRKDLREYMARNKIKPTTYHVYRISATEKEPIIYETNFNYEPTLRRRNPLTEKEYEDFKLIDKIVSEPNLYEAFVDDGKIWFTKKYHIQAGRKLYMDEEEYEIYELRAEGDELIRELLRFLKLNAEELEEDELDD